MVVSLVGAAAFAAGLLYIRKQKRGMGLPQLREVPAGERVPATISLERLRELGY